MHALARFDWPGVVQFLPALISGLWITLLVSVVGLAIGFAIGALAGLGRLSRIRPIAWISIGYIELFRGTPVLVQAIWFYFALPLLIEYTFPSLVAGIIVIGLNSGADIAEIVRGAVQSIARGLSEASRSLGMSRWQASLHVVWPQAFRRMIPPLGNQFIISIKDISLLSVILVPELIFQGRLLTLVERRMDHQ